MNSNGRPDTNGAGVAVYAGVDGPSVFLSPNARALDPRQQADLMRQAALALRVAARLTGPRR